MWCQGRGRLGQTLEQLRASAEKATEFWSFPGRHGGERHGKQLQILNRQKSNIKRITSLDVGKRISYEDMCPGMSWEYYDDNC